MRRMRALLPTGWNPQNLRPGTAGHSLSNASGLYYSSCLARYDAATQTYGNLYSNLLDYVISAALIFYILTVLGCSACGTRGPMRQP